MSKHMQLDLDRLLRDVLRMAGNVEEAIRNATHALETSQLTTKIRTMAVPAGVEPATPGFEDQCSIH